MSQFTEAFTHGLGLGTSMARDQAEQRMAMARMEQARQMAAARLGYSYDALQSQQQHNAAMEQLARQRAADAAWNADDASQRGWAGIDLGVQRLNASQNALAQKNADQQQTVRENAALLTRNVDAPIAGANYMQGDHSPESFFQTAEDLQNRRAGYEGMTLAGQRPLVQNMVSNWRGDEASNRAMARWQQMEQYRFDRKVEGAHKLWSDLPEHMKTPENYSQILSQLQGFHLPSQANQSAEQLRRAQVSHQGYLEARAQHTDTLRAIRQYRTDHDEDLKTPTDIDGQPLPATDPKWGKHLKALNELKPLLEEEKRARSFRQQAWQQSQDAKNRALGLAPQEDGTPAAPEAPAPAAPAAPGQATPPAAAPPAGQPSQATPPAPEAAMDAAMDAAMAEADRQMPGWESNPQMHAAVMDLAKRMLTQQGGAATPASQGVAYPPVEDQPVSTMDDMFGEDDGNDIEPDDDTDDELDALYQSVGGV